MKTVFVLGAGASGAEHAPMQHQLFGQFFQERDRSGHGGPELERMSAELKAFFQCFFGINTDLPQGSKTDFPTFEEVLGIIEFALQRSESFRAYSTSSTNPRLQRIRDHLVFLICIILASRLDRPGEHHRRLIRTLHRTGELESSTFVSLNYDILIDNALTEAYDAFDRDLDYGVDFVNFGLSSPGADEWRKPRDGHSSLLLKLHGSLNWLYCPTCTALTLTPKQKGVIRLLEDPDAARCRRCGTAATPIVIPPTFFKVMSNFYLQQIWRLAEQALFEADRLFFCGYSLPDADLHLKYLLKRVEVNRGSTPEVFVVNNHKGKRIAQKREEELRYKRLFNEPGRVHYTNLSFETLCKRGTAAC